MVDKGYAVDPVGKSPPNQRMKPESTTQNRGIRPGPGRLGGSGRGGGRERGRGLEGAEGVGEGFGQAVDVGAGEGERGADLQGAAVRAGRADQDAAVAQAVDDADRGFAVGLAGAGSVKSAAAYRPHPRTALIRGVSLAIASSVSRR